MLRFLSSVVIPAAVIAAAYLSLAAVPLQAQTGHGPNPSTSNCDPVVSRFLMPESIELGETAKVTLNIQPGCPNYRLPIDLVFLVDISNSMTRSGPAANDPGGQEPPGNVVPPKEPPSEPPPPGPPAPEPPAPPLILDPSLASLVPWPAASLLQEPPAPPEPPDRPEPPTVPGDPGNRNNPNAEPAGCQRTGSVNPGGGGGNVDPPGSIVPAPPTPKVPPGEPGQPTPIPQRTPPPSTNQPRPGTNEEPAGNEDLVREAQRFIRDFFDERQVQNDLQAGGLRVGLVGFNDRGRRLVGLTEQGTRAATRTSLLRGGGLTRIDIGLRTAESVLQDRSRRYGINQDKDRSKVIVVISDGGFCDRDLRARVSKDIHVVGIFAGRGPYKRRMRDIVSEPEYMIDLNARAMRDLMNFYETRFTRTRPVEIDELTIQEELDDNMSLVAGSASAGATVDGQTIEWSFAPPADSITVTYEIEPLIAGLALSVTNSSDAIWTDSEKRPGQKPFPDITIDVLAPTPEPTPTDIPPTATETPVIPPTATATPKVLLPAYLPVAFRNWPEAPKCEPRQQRVDLAIVIDTSISMSDPTTAGGPLKIDAAIGAAKALVGQLKFASGNEDQATVIGFNSSTYVGTPLTFDRVTIDAALDELKARQAPGTRIDLGLREARAELLSDRARDVATQTIVLLTDALQTDTDAGGRQLVRDEATLIKADGISIFAVGIGEGDAFEEELLLSIATRPEFYIHAPDAAELEQIYKERIAPLIPCP